MDFISVDILNFAREAGSGAVMVIMIFALLFMLNRSQKKYLESMDKYANLIIRQTETSQELANVVKNQNEKLKDLFYILNNK
jgi:predicted PurR-regulated permease PerM